MSIYNVESTNGYLKSTGKDGVAISEKVTQELVDSDFTEIKNTRMHGLYNNIINDYSIDTLKLIDVAVGNVLGIVKQDDTIGILEVSSIGTASSGKLLTPYTKVSSSTSNIYGAISNMFDSDATTETRYYVQNNWHMLINLGSLVTVTSFDFNGYGVPSGGVILQGSTDGQNWNDLYTIGSGTINDTYNIDVADQGSYAYYRLFHNTANSSYMYIKEFQMYGDTYSIDTTSITNGEAPKGAIKLDDIKVNDQLLVPQRITGTFGSSMETYVVYDDLILSSSARDLITKVEFNNIGSTIYEITYDIWKAEDTPVSFSPSKVVAVDNALSVYFPSDITVVGDLLDSCKLTLDGGAAITADSIVANTNYFVMYFPINTISSANSANFVYDDSQTTHVTETSTGDEIATGSYQALNMVV